MLELYSLISGSSGNCSVITDGKTHLMIDCGTSGKRAVDALSKLGIEPGAISAILVTHEHSDHIRGVGVMARRLKVPVYATYGTHKAMTAAALDDSVIRTVTPDAEFAIGTIGITPFSIPHDAADPCGYVFSDGLEKAAIATDIGHASDSLLSRLYGVKQIILESNHDINMLRFGDYPYPLKQRILSDTGHLSNKSAAEAALKLTEHGTEHIMLGHLSEKNNMPEIAMLETHGFLTDNGVKVDKDVTLRVAARYDITKFERRF